LNEEAMIHMGAREGDGSVTTEEERTPSGSLPESETVAESPGFDVSAFLIGSTRRMFLATGVLPLLLVGLILFFGIVEPRFLSGANLFNLSRQATYLIIITLGQALVLMSGGFDLSVGGTVALTSVVTAKTMSTQVLAGATSASAAALGAAAGLGVGIGIGLANGFAVAVLKVSPFVVTLAMSSVAVGLGLMISNGVPIGGLPRGFSDGLGTGSIGGIPVPVWIALVVAAVMLVVVSRTRFGRYVYAIGGNEKAAHLSGVSVVVNKWAVYVICSTLAAIAGVMLTARVSSGEPNLGGSFPLESIAAAVLGGVSLGGGEGRLSGAVGGAVFVVMLQNGMNLIRVQSYVQMVVIGVALVVAVVIDRLRARVNTG
jgi:ribose transport system permease protein